MDSNQLQIPAETQDDFDFQLTHDVYEKIQDILTQQADNTHQRIKILQDIEHATKTRIFSCNQQHTRLNLERYLDAIYQHAAELTVTAPDTKLYYPTIDSNNFSQRLANLPELQQFTIPPLTQSSFTTQRSGEFSRTPSQKFVSTFISPETPYNGILLWHGVGTGKTCSTISIAENIIDHYQADGKRVLIVTPSEQLHDTWRQEIFNLGKEQMKNKYNLFIQQGYQASFETWLGLQHLTTEQLEAYRLGQGEKPTYYPINNIQCTGNRYNPYRIDPNATKKRLYR